MGSMGLLVSFALIASFIIAMLAVFSAIRIVPEDKRLAIYRLGRYIGDKGPGIVLLIPIIDLGKEKDLGSIGQVGGGPVGVHVRRMIGWAAQTTTSIFSESGKVVLDNGESVDAISAIPIPAGQTVRVKRVIVEVESVE